MSETTTTVTSLAPLTGRSVGTTAASGDWTAWMTAPGVWSATGTGGTFTNLPTFSVFRMLKGRTVRITTPAA